MSARRLAFAPLLMFAACASPPGVGVDDPGTDAGVDAEVCEPTGPEIAGDGVDNDCDGIVDELYVCADGSQPFTTIAAAIAAAPAGSGVEVCAGTYRELLVIDRPVRINGAGAASTIIEAGGTGIAVMVGGGHEVTVSGFTLRGGATTGPGAAVRCTDAGIRLIDAAILDSRAEAGGGGLAANGCTVHVERVRFSGNEGVTAGGGAHFVNSTGAVIDSDFVGNSADRGGAVAVEGGRVDIRASRLNGNRARVHGGALYQASDSAVEDSTLSNNLSNWTGGAVYVLQHAPTFRRNFIEANEAEWEGGGFYLHQSQAVFEANGIVRNKSFDDGGGLRIFESAVRMERNVISENHAVDGDGGAFKCSHVAGTFIDNQITNNIALGAGGGIEFDNDSSTMRGGVVSGNRSSIGGGIHVMLWPWNGGLIEGVQITGNRAWRGGGMYIENNFRPVTIRNVRIENNTAHQGAGVYVRGTPLVMSNSLLTGNASTDAGAAFYVDPSASYPWTQMCPCPPIDPPAKVEFITAHANRAEDGGAAFWIGAPNFTVESSIFSGHTGTAVIVAPAVQPSWSYNDTFPATFAGMNAPTGVAGNISSDPTFMGVTDFHLHPSSACRDAGNPAVTDLDGSRADMGLYAGPLAAP